MSQAPSGESPSGKSPTGVVVRSPLSTVFARPGLGRYLTTALFAADIPAILGGTLLIGVCFVLINGVTDVCVKLLDPRIR